MYHVQCLSVVPMSHLNNVTPFECVTLRRLLHIVIATAQAQLHKLFA